MKQVDYPFDSRGFNFVLLCVLVFAGVDFIAAVLFGFGDDLESTWVLTSAFTGVAWSQITLYAIWCVLAPFPFVLRLVVGAAIAVALSGAFVFGLALAGPMDRTMFSSVEPLFHIPILSLALQLPLWSLRLFFSWRIVHQSTDANAEPLLIRDVFACTAFIAVVLGATRCIEEPGLVIVLGVTLFAFGLVTALPAVAIMRMREMWVGVLVFALPGGLPLLLVLTVFGLAQGEMPFEVPAGTVLLLSSFYGSASCALIAARMLGYRLVWGRRATTGEVDDGGETANSVSPSRGMLDIGETQP